MKRCRTLTYVGLGEERICGNKAVYIFDAGKPSEYPVCLECSKWHHPKRLTTISARQVSPTAADVVCVDVSKPGA
jgi:hypothetical protein